MSSIRELVARLNTVEASGVAWHVALLELVSYALIDLRSQFYRAGSPSHHAFDVRLVADHASRMLRVEYTGAGQ